MSDLRELYQEVIIDHGRNPRNFGILPKANHHAEGFNPLCGDRLQLYIDVENGKIEGVSFEGSGCAISMASASLMSEALKGKTLEEAEALFQNFHDMLTRPQYDDAANLGKLQVLSGVKEFPMRVKCATLAWHTLRATLKDQDVPVTTE